MNRGPGGALREKKHRKVFLYTVFPKRPRVAHMFNHGWWRLAVGRWWRLAVGIWQLVVGVVGGGWWLAIGGWWWLAVVGGWRLQGCRATKSESKALQCHCHWRLALRQMKYPVRQIGGSVQGSQYTGLQRIEHITGPPPPNTSQPALPPANTARQQDYSHLLRPVLRSKGCSPSRYLCTAAAALLKAPVWPWSTAVIHPTPALKPSSNCIHPCVRGATPTSSPTWIAHPPRGFVARAHLPEPGRNKVRRGEGGGV